MKSERSRVRAASHSSRFSRLRLYLKRPTVTLKASLKLNRTAASSSWKSVSKPAPEKSTGARFGSANSPWT